MTLKVGGESAPHEAQAALWIENTISAQAVTDRSQDVVASAYAGLAQAHALLALVEQQRIANKLLVAQIDQLTGIASYMPGPGAQVDPSIRIRSYLSDDEWAGLDL